MEATTLSTTGSNTWIHISSYEMCSFSSITVPSFVSDAIVDGFMVPSFFRGIDVVSPSASPKEGYT
jgi:hypothetical protein